MSYKDGQTGYPQRPLASRAIIKKNLYALIPQEGLVKNNIPGFENCDISILASPKLGAGFVDYSVSLNPGGYNKSGFGGEGIEIFVYVIKGRVLAGDGHLEYDLPRGGFLYLPPDRRLLLNNQTGEAAEIFLYKRRYRPLDGHWPSVVHGEIDHLPSFDYEGMKDVQIWNLLPVGDPAYDLNFHILSFERGASHGYVETHVQEHGAIILEGEGMYNLDNQWLPVRKGDYIFMGAYAPQAAYGIGRQERFSYLYSKDCNRDEII